MFKFDSVVAVKPTFRHDYSTIVYGQYCDTFQDLYESFYSIHSFVFCLLSISMSCIVDYMSDGDSIDGLFY